MPHGSVNRVPEVVVMEDGTEREKQKTCLSSSAGRLISEHLYKSGHLARVGEGTAGHQDHERSQGTVSQPYYQPSVV